MKPGDTTLGGLPAAFPETEWDVLTQARDVSPELRRAGYEGLARRYWKPIYHFLRASWAKSNEDSKDLVQAFFLWLLEGDALARYDRARASFRSYLKSLLRHFLQNSDESLRRLKRGGGLRILPLDREGSDLEAVLPDPSSADPDKAFDRAWRDLILARALERVRERMRSRNCPEKFRIFEEYYLSRDPGRPTYAAVAQRLGIKESDVLHALAALREEVRAEIREELSRSASGPGDLEGEWNAFLGA